MKKKPSRIPAYLEKLGVHHKFQVYLGDADADMVVVIPCYDEPAPEKTIHSLANTINPGIRVLVLFIHNYSERESETVKRRIHNTYESLLPISTPDWLVVKHFLCDNLPAKDAGVGLARKIGMDAAADLLSRLEKPQVPIVCLDADCTVAANYFTALHRTFQQFEDMPAASIHFEHPLSGDEYPPPVYEAIVQYELHLRYFIEACRFTGHPYIYQTVGSSMAVRAEHYAQQGGMNKRQAGEDFYFLHKFTHLNGFREISDTCVFPSPRKSHRVPFGTGKAVNDLLQTEQSKYQTYSLDSFFMLRELFSIFPALYKASAPEIEKSFQKMTKSLIIEDSSGLLQRMQTESVNTESKKNHLKGSLHQILSDFLPLHELQKQVAMAGSHAANKPAYMKRMWQWFNPFVMMKMLHFVRDAGVKNEDVDIAAAALLPYLGHHAPSGNARQLLEIYRSLAKG